FSYVLAFLYCHDSPGNPGLWYLRGMVRNMQWHENRKGCSVVLRPRSAEEMNVAMMLLNNVFGNPKSEAGSDICFGGKEWLEYIFSDMRWNADARIEDCDSHPGLKGVAPIAGAGHADDKRSTRRHCVNRIANQV